MLHRSMVSLVRAAGGTLLDSAAIGDNLLVLNNDSQTLSDQGTESQRDWNH